MTLRFFRFLACQLLLIFACVQAQAADAVDIARARIEATEDGYRLSANFAFELNNALEGSIQHGIDLFFTTEVEMTRPRWYWTDEKAVSSRRTLRLHYDALLRQYSITVTGSIQRTFQSFDEALAEVRRSSWMIAPRGALEPGKTYNVALRFYMDHDYLKKPLQVNAINNSDWQLSSGKKTFTYKAE